MRWARTLMIADMLTKAIQSNVAHEARPNATPSDKETLMSDDQLPPATPVATDPVPAPAAAPQSTDTSTHVSASTGIDVDARLHHATRLAEMLNNNPKIHSFLCALMGIATKDLSKEI